MALGKVIGLDAGASWNPSLAVIPSYINNFTDGTDYTFLWVSTESAGEITATIDSETFYTVTKINDKEFVIERTSTTSGYDASSTTATITINVGQDATNGYAAMTRTVTIGPSSYTFNTLTGIPTKLSKCTPAQIQQVLNSGQADSYFEDGVGSNTAPIKLNSTSNVGCKPFSNVTSFCAYVLGFNHNAEKETNGKNSIHFSLSRRVDKVSGEANKSNDIAFVDSKLYTTGSDAAFRMNLTNSNSGGWKMSYMRTAICRQFYSAIDSSWRDYIKLVKKYTDNVGGATDTEANINDTEDYIFLMAEFEIFGTRSYANSSEQNYQQRYDYYANNNEASARIRGADSAVSNSTAGSVALGAAVHWWERSPGMLYNLGRQYIMGWGTMFRTGAPADDSERGVGDYYISSADAKVDLGFVPNFVMVAD